jgi:small neutral amino acid transporter SnatA (MarC family)
MKLLMMSTSLILASQNDIHSVIVVLGIASVVFLSFSFLAAALIINRRLTARERQEERQ